ncbi:hypothetical protein [Croceivirga thetidis]|uniref:Uncharacterized protein n=1 Tax=Croceivirga thetidis TaxID=2721623 RepID=A0ABX1GV03_9FLAO|nr:hypothetical protein [Croceivirga thetidis]NKI32745.1 hypothetical protein [Croceivirga thetidis]
MGIFWDLLQQNELEKQQKQADSVEERVAILEEELSKTKSLLRKTLEALENHLGKDIDGDGLTGAS